MSTTRHFPRHCPRHDDESSVDLIKYPMFIKVTRHYKLKYESQIYNISINISINQ